MAVVTEVRIENTVVRIHDDSCRGTTPEQAGEILKRITLRAKAAFRAAAGSEEEEKQTALV